jgi:hypothetical protein
MPRFMRFRAAPMPRGLPHAVKLAAPRIRDLAPLRPASGCAILASTGERSGCQRDRGSGRAVPEGYPGKSAWSGTELLVTRLGSPATQSKPADGSGRVYPSTQSEPAGLGRMKGNIQ